MFAYHTGLSERNVLFEARVPGWESGHFEFRILGGEGWRIRPGVSQIWNQHEKLPQNHRLPDFYTKTPPALFKGEISEIPT